MNIMSISNQKFEGRVIGCSWFTPKQRKIFKQVRPCLEKMVKNKDYNLRIYKSYGKELRIAAGKNPAYMVIEPNDPAIWINRAKEVIAGIKQDSFAK